ncbi:hypothetical protein Ancab_020526 [Ancistrocladus abbreviatus]
MFNTCDGSARRILTFPAVHLCQGISTATLLDSLISLSNQICELKFRNFTSNKRNARNSIRLIEVLLLLLEELRDLNLEPRRTINLSLSELHLILQKILFLLEDCTRQGARIWLLMKAERVANYFPLLMKDLALALDVLPLDCSVNVSVEGKECVEFLIKQARKLRFEVESGDYLTSNLVVSILGRFERKVIPDPNELRRVLEYLRIRKWSECNREVRFLDEEIGLDKSSNNEAAFLSSLRGLMVYCRCVLFDVVDIETDRRNLDKGSDWLTLNCLNSEDFRCPISLEIMAEPVTISSGHTYDRASIQKWFKEGNPICPKTGERLRSSELVPNFALQSLIRAYCAENGIAIPKLNAPDRDISKTISAGSPAAEEAMEMAAHFLMIKLAIGTSDERNKAAYEIRLLTKKSIFNRTCLVDCGAVPYLLNLSLSKDSVAQENAVAALLNLSKHSKAKAIIVENRGLPMILNVLKGGIKMEARQHAAAVFFYLSSVEEYCGLIGSTGGAIPALVELIRVGNKRGKKNALVAIFGLLLHPGNHYRVLDAKLVPLLVDLLGSLEKEELMVDSLAVLSALAEKPDGATAILQAAALNVVVEILCSSTSRFGKEHCVSLLLALCKEGGREVVKVLAKNPSLIGNLYSILTDGTARASKKASAIISIFHEFSETSSSLVPHPLPRERFIHVR